MVDAHAAPGGRLLTLAALLCLAACRSPAPHPPTTPFEGEALGLIRAPDALGLDVVWRQRVTASWQDPSGDAGSQGFEAVLQKRGPRLILMGLSPMGSVGFVITLEGEAIEMRNESGEELPFPPRFVLIDVQRVFYPWVSAGEADPTTADAAHPRVPAGAPLPDGSHVAELGGEQVRETWSQGRLRTRRFRRLDDQPPGEVVVTYTWDPTAVGDDGAAPLRAVLTNNWFGYELIIDTLEETLLDTDG